MSRGRAVRLLAEAGGTALLLGIGTGAMVATAGQSALRLWFLPLAWFAAVSVPVLLLASTSGAHLNPVVTLALWIRKKLTGADALTYVGAQLAGAVAGSSSVLLLLGTGDRLGATVPTGDLRWDLLGEVSFTSFLVIAVLVIADLGVGPLRWRLLLPGGVVAASTYVLGPWTRSSLNPARTLAPALLTGIYSDLWLYLISAPLGAVGGVLVWAAFRRGAGEG